LCCQRPGGQKCVRRSHRGACGRDRALADNLALVRFEDCLIAIGPEGSRSTKSDNLARQPLGLLQLASPSEFGKDVGVLVAGNTGSRSLPTVAQTFGGGPISAWLRNTGSWIYDDEAGRRSLRPKSPCCWRPS
jgi:hypothetical protein